MTPEELSAYFERIRARQREIQLNVYRTRTAAAYHIGNVRDMVADSDRAQMFTGLDDVTDLLTQLPRLIGRIEHFNGLADDAWAQPRNTDKLAEYDGVLLEAYDAIQIQPRVYERLVRRTVKPVLDDAQVAKDLPCDDPSRLAIEQFVRLEIEDYLATESETASIVQQIDADRDSVVQAYHEPMHEYLQAKGRSDEASFAAGLNGIRLAATSFDDRQGYGFMDYAGAWIDRELDRANQSADT